MTALDFVDSVPEILRAPLQLWWQRFTTVEGFNVLYAAASARCRSELPRVVAASEFVGGSLIQDPQALAWIDCHDQPTQAQAANARCEAVALESTSIAAAQLQLRQWRRREMMRLAWRDIAGRASVADTLLAVSELADASVRTAVSIAQRHLQPTFGLPRDASGAEVPFIVLGMGKLGGRELNFSSDIDLIFLFGAAGTSDGPRAVDNEEYFTRLGREFIRLLDARTEDGFAFRVDMRLRPFGDSGALAVGLASLENYLQEHGRDWERYAWIKARAIVGNAAYAAAYQEFVRSFVYRRYLDFGVFESLREMKAMIVRDVSRHDLDQHLKLGRGGIREIEFIVQSLQLVRGGSDNRLQTSSLLEVLPRLAGSKLMSAAAAAQLTAAYLVLRKAENALQIMRDQQTHSLPGNALDQARFALISGANDWESALQQVEAARNGVALQFESLLFGAPRGGESDAAQSQRRYDDSGIAWIDADEADSVQELKKTGFPAASVAAVAAALDAYRRAASYRRLEESGRRRLHVILQRLLASAAKHAEPARVVQRVLRVLEAIGARSSYLALLKEQPPALDRLIDVCSISGFLSRQIADFPLLLDELIDAKAFDELPTRAGFVQELSARTERLTVDEPERHVEALRQFQKAAVFSVALADLTDRLPLMRVSDRLTDIAELIVERCMDLAWRQMTQLYGVPHCGEPDSMLRPVAVAVAGYGKLGGIELGYRSDLDLVFLHNSRGAIQATAGDRSIDNAVFFLRLGQRIVHLLTMHSAAGRLYEVDMRLRPNGKGGFLMTGIDAFERYQLDEAWTWEHQALLRARAVGGDAAVCAAFEATRRRALTGSVRRATLRTDVAEMRVRMRRELSKAKRGQFDIKQDAGGIADIEFLVQYWVLAAAADHPELLTYTDNIRQLQGLAAAGILEATTAMRLTDAYVRYRTVLHHLSLEAEGERVVEAAAYQEMRSEVQEIWTHVFGQNRGSVYSGVKS